MTTEKTFFALILVGLIFSGILYVVFGQVTVRKLRKNPKTKGALGIALASGWDIINVAQVFASPKSWVKKVENSRFSFLYPNATALYENTTKFDRVLGFVFYWLLMLSGGAMILLVSLSYLGFFSE